MKRKRKTQMRKKEDKKVSPSNDSEESDEMELFLNVIQGIEEDDKRNMEGEMNKENEQRSQTGERGETTIRNRGKSFVVHFN